MTRMNDGKANTKDADHHSPPKPSSGTAHYTQRDTHTVSRQTAKKLRDAVTRGGSKRRAYVVPPQMEPDSLIPDDSQPIPAPGESDADQPIP